MTSNPDHSTDARPEHVMLDLGPGVGALVLHTDRELHGMEIEISPAGRDDERGHKQVHERPVAGRPLFRGAIPASRLCATGKTLYGRIARACCTLGTCRVVFLAMIAGRFGTLPLSCATFGGPAGRVGSALTNPA